MNKKLRLWTLKIPIKYYGSQIGSFFHDWQICFDINKNKEIIFNVEKQQFNYENQIWCSEIKAKLKSIKDKDKVSLVLEIDDILAIGEIEAFEYINKFLMDIAYTITLEMTLSNVNIHNYQPNVIFDFDKISTSSRKFQPYEDYILSNNIVNNNNINYGIATSSLMTNFLNSDRCIDIYDKYKNFQYKVLVKYLYNALGDEDIQTKFFYLFLIIEFIEKNFNTLSNSKKIFDETTINNIELNSIFNNLVINKEQKYNIASRIKKMLLDITDIGRANKLLNILHSFGINNIDYCSNNYLIDIQFCNKIIDIRNKLFHSNTNDNSMNEIEKINIKLLVVDLKIIKYLMNINN